MSFYFDPSSPIENGHASSTGPLPPGWYMAAITETFYGDNKKGTGSYLRLTFSVTNKNYSGRTVGKWLNLENSNPKAVYVARQEMSTICKHLGLTDAFRDPSVMLNIPIGIYLEQGEYNGKITNVIKSYRNASEFITSPIDGQMYNIKDDNKKPSKNPSRRNYVTAASLDAKWAEEDKKSADITEDDLLF